MTAIPERDACEECGRTYGVWWADHDVWNYVIGGDATVEAGGMLCPSCFIDKADECQFSARAWKLVPEFPDGDAGSEVER